MVRIGGAGHSAAIHSEDPAVIMEFGARVPVLRVSVNVGNSTGSSGLETNLALSMTLGTGFVGRSSIGENLEPRHLVNWTRIAYNADPGVRFGSFSGISPWHARAGTVPPYPIASNLPGGGGIRPPDWRERDGAGGGTAGYGAQVPGETGLPDSVRAALREMIIDELRALVRD